MTIIYCVIFVAFIASVMVLINSSFIKYKEQSILTKASERISDGYLIFTANGKVTNFNKSFLKSFGFNKNQIKDKYISEIFNKENFDKDDVKRILESFEDIRKSNKNINFDIKDKENQKIYKIDIKSIVNNDIFLRYVMIFKDVTNTYKIIEELQNNQDMMANREKFATLGQLISRNSTFIKIPNFFYIW